jgi:flagellar basal-body rod modification protein FlgD
MSSYIDSISQAATTQNATSASSTSKNDEVLGKEDFLTLLVAQLQNQDPLNPDDPTEFTAQLAQFSSLEQLFNLNESMESLVTAYNSSDKLSTLNTIGKEAAYQSSSFSYDGEPVTLGYKLDAQASEVTLALQKDGSTIALLKGTELSKGTHYMTWDGLGSNGQTAPVGDYKIVIQAKAGEGQSVAASPVIRSEVTGVDLDGSNGGTLLTRAGEVSFNSIIGVFERDSLPKSTTDEENSEEDINNAATTADTIEDTVTDTVTDAVTDSTEQTV